VLNDNSEMKVVEHPEAIVPNVDFADHKHSYGLSEQFASPDWRGQGARLCSDSET
jgi:hypothetical protein